MGQSGSKTNKNSSKKIKNNNIAPKGDKSKNNKKKKENKIIEKAEFLDDLDPYNPGYRRKQYISAASKQDLNRIFFD